MRTVNIGKSGLLASQVVYGCMQLGEIDQKQADEMISTALECGINIFDNADIYGGGDCEKRLGQSLKNLPIAREDIIIQSKCGIENHIYDFSKEHILKSVDASLSRLGLDYLDILLLHRPDALMEPQEVAEALNHLQNTGKVRQFGVSNQHPMQMELLKKHLNQALIANQLQFSPVHADMIQCGILVNTEKKGSEERDGLILDYCRLNDITIQAWSPYQKGHMEGPFLQAPEYQKLNDTIRSLAKEKNSSEEAIVSAWIMRHPAGIQVISGTTKPDRLRRVCDGSGLTLSRPEWYSIYTAAGNEVP